MVLYLVFKANSSSRTISFYPQKMAFIYYYSTFIY